MSSMAENTPKTLAGDGVAVGPHRRRRYVHQGGAETGQGEPSTLDVDVDPTGTSNGPQIDAEGSEESAPEVQDTANAVTIPSDATTVDALLQWVNGTSDPEVKVARAQAALDAENARGGPRVTLVGPLEDLITAPSDTD